MSLSPASWRRRTSGNQRKGKTPKSSSSNESPSPPPSPKHRHRDSNPMSMQQSQQTILFVNTIEEAPPTPVESHDNFLGSNSSQCLLGSDASTFVANYNHSLPSSLASPNSTSNIVDLSTHQGLFDSATTPTVNPSEHGGLFESATLEPQHANHLHHRQSEPQHQFTIRPVPDSPTKKSSHRRARSVDNNPTKYSPTNHNPFFSLILDQSFQKVSQQHQEGLLQNAQQPLRSPLTAPLTPQASSSSLSVSQGAFPKPFPSHAPLPNNNNNSSNSSNNASRQQQQDSSAPPMAGKDVVLRAQSVEDHRSVVRSTPGDMKQRVHHRKKTGSTDEIRSVIVGQPQLSTATNSNGSSKTETKEKERETKESERGAKERDRGEKEGKETKDKVNLRQSSKPGSRETNLAHVGSSSASSSLLLNSHTPAPIPLNPLISPETSTATTTTMPASTKDSSSKQSSNATSPEVTTSTTTSSSAASNPDLKGSVRRIKKHSKQKSDDTEKISKTSQREREQRERKRMGKDKQASEKVIINPFCPEILKSIDKNKSPTIIKDQSAPSLSASNTTKSASINTTHTTIITTAKSQSNRVDSGKQPASQPTQPSPTQQQQPPSATVESLTTTADLLSDVTTSNPLEEMTSNNNNTNGPTTGSNNKNNANVENFGTFGMNNRKPKLVREKSLTFSISNVSEFNFKLSEESSSIETLGPIEVQMNLFQNMEDTIVPKTELPQFEVDAPSIKPEEIIRQSLLGRGTFGKVWRGLWKNQPVAIKDIPSLSKKEIQMWHKEIHLLSQLQDAEYLVNIKAYSVSEHFLTIVMQIMEGGSLYDIIHEDKNVPWSMLQKVRILRHVAKGIEAIHAKNIIHRDLKSMNVLMDGAGNAKIADLGCASFYNLTMTLNVGSPLWMAPEVRSGSYSFPADIFSYGVVAFEVFNECLPNYSFEEKCVVIAPTCIGYPIIKQCSQVNPADRPSAFLVIEMMDSLIVTFVSSVMTFLKVNSNLKFDHTNFDNDEISYWYNILLHYDRQTFDVLLSNALETLAPRNLRKALVQTNPNSHAQPRVT